MTCTHRRILQWVFGTFCLLLTAPLVWGSPTGLNNIPTTDIVSEKTLVLQTWSNLAPTKYPQQYVGMKFSPLKNLEIGFDWKASDKTHGHPTLQAKYAFDIKKDLLTGVLGVANVSDDRKHQGEVFPYAALGLDLKAFRLHFGYAPERRNEAFFAGIDKTVPFLNRNLVLRADAIQTRDGEDFLYSVGFLYELARKDDGEESTLTGLAGVLNKIANKIVLEGWVSLPSTTDPAVVTLKVNYVIKF
ncbi:MAG: hypothetical protein QGD94_07600 [Planctomycetia bacterium]|nr:hypothetical protein [Planctomycetia bacterium]